jgi:hypothetical protein
MSKKTQVYIHKTQQTIRQLAIVASIREAKGSNLGLVLGIVTHDFRNSSSVMKILLLFQQMHTIV